MMGVLGAEFGQEMEPSKHKDKEEKKKQQAVKGFGITDYSHARHTSKYIKLILNFNILQNCKSCQLAWRLS